VYIDLTFFQELRDRFGAPGDFAQAYVIAHEFGHHVQHQLRLDDNLRQGDNEASVRFELQADCLAGVWARSAEEEGLLETGDLEEGLGAAASVGDDRIQQQTQGRVDPETWTHGSAEQRTTAFQRGFDGGRLRSCVNG
jgi:predicted metalloprotease